MGDYAVYAAITCGRPVADSTLESVSRQLRPDDEQMCVYVDEYDANVLWISSDVRAPDLSTALTQGRSLAEEAVRLSDVPMHIHEVSAMDDEFVDEWRP